MKKILIINAAFLFGSLCQAMEGGGDYSFTSACSSQGVWTDSALSATQNLRKVTLLLKDNPNCKALGNSVEGAIAQLETQVKSAADTPQRASRMSQIPQEIGALRSFAQGTPDMRANVLQLMMNRSIEGATLSAQVEPPPQNSSGTLSAASGMIDFGVRLQRSTSTGLDLLNRVVDNIPQIDLCLDDANKGALGSYVSMAVQVASSFASTGSDNAGSKLATAVSKISNLIREKKYTKILGKLNQQEFLASMSCLMEVTSESFCQARDGMELFKKGMKDLNLGHNQKNVAASASPFTGYYILNTHVPNVTRWLQKVQIGVDPRLPTDAQFQNKISEDVSSYNKDVKNLQALYYTSVTTMQSLPSLESKQTAIIKLVSDMTNLMNGAGFGDTSKMNFFTINKVAMKIPFFLIGMDTIPDQVLGKAQGLGTLDPISWMQANITNIPGIKSPEALAETIGAKMKELVGQANISSTEYFNKWFIVDKSALVIESVTDVNYTVKDSLIAIDTYLETLQGKIVSLHGEVSSIPTIVETREKISKILAAYSEVESLGKLWSGKDHKNITPEELQRIAAAYETLINVVYEQFNVSLAKSGFLANRMTILVHQDYIMLLRNKINFTEYQTELFTATGMAALDRMIQIYNGNPANALSDLNMALKINKGNLESLEMLLKDNIIGNIAQLEMTAEGRKNSYRNTNSLARAGLEGQKNLRLDSINHAIITLSKVTISAVYNLWSHGDRYPISIMKQPQAPQSEFSDAKGLHDQLCIQALSFVDQKGVKELCADAVLKSPLTTDKKYAVSYRQKLKSHLKDASVTDPNMRLALNHSDRICAFRDYNRKNKVLFMLLGRTQ